MYKRQVQELHEIGILTFFETIQIATVQGDTVAEHENLIRYALQAREVVADHRCV